MKFEQGQIVKKNPYEFEPDVHSTLNIEGLPKGFIYNFKLTEKKNWA